MTGSGGSSGGRTVDARPMLDGAANVDDNVLDLPAGPVRAMSIRSFDRATGTWSIWWLDGGNPKVLETPMVGSFVDGVGTFLADDTFDGRPIRARFLWTRMETGSPRWEQAYSVDGGATWETNWIMDFTRAE
jgi:hypothetical protein